MTVAFLVPRKGFLRVLGSLIQAAVERKHRVLLLRDPHEPKPGELVRDEDLRAWPGAEAAVYGARGRAALLPLLKARGVDALVGPSLHYLLRAWGIDREAGGMGRAGVRLFSVDYLLETVTSDPEGYRAIDTTFYASEYQRQLHWRLLAGGFARLRDEVDLRARSAVCGSTLMDQLALVDREAVRRRYGLGARQPVVLLMSLKMAVPDPWRRLVWGRGPAWYRAARALATGRAAWAREIVRGHGYRDLLEALERLCRRSGAALVVKSREKNEDPPFLARVADVFVYDEQIFPYTSMELMAIADLCVHFQSGAVLEAAFCGVPSLSVRVSQEHLKEYASFGEIYGGQPGSLQNFPGVVTLAEPREALALLDRSTLADFGIEAEARRRYVEKFLGFDDTRSSERVLDAMERTLTAGRPRG